MQPHCQDIWKKAIQKLLKRLNLGGAHVSLRSDVEGERATRCATHLPPTSPTVYRQADCTNHKLRRQAAIAIENTRLLSELRQRTDELGRSVGELRALGEVSQAVNSTLELETVLSTIVAKAVQLSGTEAGAIYVFDNAQREFRLRATYGMDQELIEALTQRHIGLDEPNITLLSWPVSRSRYPICARQFPRLRTRSSCAPVSARGW
jgi:hypothetical protein